VSLSVECLFLLSDEHSYIDLVYYFFFSTSTCFSCPLQPSSGRTLVHRKSKERHWLTKRVKVAPVTILWTVLYLMLAEVDSWNILQYWIKTNIQDLYSCAYQIVKINTQLNLLLGFMGVWCRKSWKKFLRKLEFCKHGISDSYVGVNEILCSTA
jgi:hypothetical protein